MATIGTFEKDGDGFVGSVSTLTFRCDARFVANSEKRTENSPDYFIKAGDCDLGVGWRSKAKGKAGKPYVRVILDDPGFPAPVEAVLLGLDGAASLVWKRSESQ
jgi:uncharacterized protein (DUF736 family)